MAKGRSKRQYIKQLEQRNKHLEAKNVKLASKLQSIRAKKDARYRFYGRMVEFGTWVFFGQSLSSAAKIAKSEFELYQKGERALPIAEFISVIEAAFSRFVRVGLVSVLLTFITGGGFFAFLTYGEMQRQSDLLAIQNRINDRQSTLTAAQNELLSVQNEWTSRLVSQDEKQGYKTRRDRLLEILYESTASNPRILAEAAMEFVEQERPKNPRPDLSKANLASGRFYDFDFSGVKFRDAILENANLVEAALEDSNLIDSKLNGAHMARANLKGATLRGASLKETDLTEAICVNADLRDLETAEGARLFEANLSGSNLTDANMRGADLTAANLTRAVLIDTDFTGARLMGVNLSECDWANTVLDGANLTKTKGLDVEKVKKGAFWNADTEWPPGTKLPSERKPPES